MREIVLESWQAFETEIDVLANHLAAQKSDDPGYIARPIFRGQSRSDWGLQTSIERYLGTEISVETYNRYLLRIKPAVEAYTERSWTVERKVDTSLFPFGTVPNYEFMLYARHHGFPSPLLDWSESPYVALFFAYQQAKVDEAVSVYAFVKSLGHGRSGWAAAPNISAQGPYVTAHRRHFIQQCQYTIATKEIDDTWVYCAHDAYFQDAKDEEQDLLFKFILPGEHKVKYLQRLQQMNLNAFTLFGTEESLMEMLAFREIIERDL